MTDGFNPAINGLPATTKASDSDGDESILIHGLISATRPDCGRRT